VSQRYGPPRPLIGIALPFLSLYEFFEHNGKDTYKEAHSFAHAAYIKEVSISPAHIRGSNSVLAFDDRVSQIVYVSGQINRTINIYKT
jgi:hypothetical protein